MIVGIVILIPKSEFYFYVMLQFVVMCLVWFYICICGIYYVLTFHVCCFFYIYHD